MPVVPGPQRRETEFGVVALPEHRAREPSDQGGEVQRCPDSGEVHVGDAGVDIPTAAAHFVEAGGLHTPFLFWPADDGVESDVRIAAALVMPHLGAVVGLHDLRRAVGQRVREAALEHVGWLDDVVVNRDEDVLSLPRRRVRQQRHT